MKMKTTSLRRTAAWISAAALTLSLAGCGAQSTAASRTLDATALAASGQKLTLGDGDVNITAAGTYTLSGTLEDGQIVVEVDKDAEVTLVLDGVSVTCSDGPALWAKHGKITLVLNDGTENSLTDGAEYASAEETDEDAPNAALFSQDDLTITGGGSLTVTANCNDGVASKDDLTVESGSVTITSVGDGLRAGETLTVADGTFVITTGGGAANGAVHTETMGGGMAGGRGSMQGKPDATAGATAAENTDTAVQAISQTDATAGATTESRPEMPSGGMGGERPQLSEGAEPPADAGTDAPQLPEGAEPSSDAGTDAPQQEQAASDTADATEESTGSKGLKAGEQLLVTGGSFTLNCADDALHTNGDCTISGGTFTIATGDDGVHADGALTITGGSITVTESYEGLEGTDVSIEGGEMSITSSDDGVNAAGGSDGASSFDFFSGSTGTLSISGGTLWVNADGDGLDANGSATMSGGLVLVNGPTNSGNGALDYDGSFTVTGGTLVAVGASGMAQSPSSDSAQPSLMVTFSSQQAAGTALQLCDAQGDVLFTFETAKSFNSVLVSTPALALNESYTLCTGGSGDTNSATGYAEGGVKGSDVVTAVLAASTTSVNEDGSTAASGGMMGGGAGGRGAFSAG